MILWRIFNTAFTAALITAFAVGVSAQDLGSSNGLFKTGGSSKSKPAPAKPKTSSTSSKSSSKSTASKTSTTKKPTTTAKKSTETAKSTTRTNTSSGKTSPKKPVATSGTSASQKSTTKSSSNSKLPTKVVIKVGQPVGGDYADLFETAIDEGNNARDVRDYQRAEAAYLRAQSLLPKDFRAGYGLGNLYADQQRWEEAETAYRGAVNLEQNAVEPLIALAFVLSQPVFADDLTARYAEAERLSRKAIGVDVNNALAYDQLGVAMELQGNIGADTVAAYRRAITLEPKFALSYAHLGRLLRRKGMITESADAYSNAIKHSTDVPTMIMVADVMQSQQRYLESEQLLRRALREDTRNPTALFLLGRALTTRGSYAEAETILRKSTEVSPTSFVSYVLLGTLFSRQNRFDDAEMALLQALRVVSANEKRRLAQEFEGIADGYMRTGKRSEAARNYRRTQMLDPKRAGIATKISRADSN